MMPNTDQKPMDTAEVNSPAGVSCAAPAGYVVAATLTRSTQEGWSTRVETKLLMWIGDAQSEDEAVGAAIRKMLKDSPGFALQMHVVSTNPHTAPDMPTASDGRPIT